MQHVMQLFVVLFLDFRPFKDMHSHMQRHVQKRQGKFFLYIHVTRIFTAFLRHVA